MLLTHVNTLLKLVLRRQGVCGNSYKKEESGSRSAFPGVEEFLQEFLFAVLEYEEPGEDFGDDGGDSDNDLPEEGDWLAIVASPPPSKMWVSVGDITALQSNISPLTLSLILLLVCFLIGSLLKQGHCFKTRLCLYLH